MNSFRFLQYEAIIEAFIATHKQYEALEAGGFTTHEIRKDLEHMEKEKDQLMKRIDRLKMKVNIFSLSLFLLVSCKLIHYKSKKMNFFFFLNFSYS